MATYVEGRGIASEVEPLGLLSEGAAGIAAVVLSVIALAGVSPATLAAIVTIVIGAGLMAQGVNSAAETSKMTTAVAGAGVPAIEFGGATMVDFLTGITGIVLGVLALVGINASHLVPAALIVFGAALLLGGAIGMRPAAAPFATASAGQNPVMSGQGLAAVSGMELMVGVAAIVLGILSLILMPSSWILVLVGFIAAGVALLMVSATFDGTVMRLFANA
jgi:hypothetical protein